MEANNGLEAIRGETLVDLGGKPRRLVYDWNAIAALEEAGRPMLNGKGWSITDARSFRLLLWAGLLRDEPTITLEEVGRLMPTKPKAVKAMRQAYADAVAAMVHDDSDDDEEGDPDEDADPQSGRASDGMTSGRSPASDLA